jgi:uncharacterized protein YqeY
LSGNVFDLALTLMYKAGRGRIRSMEKQKLTEERIQQLLSQVLRDKNKEAISVIKMVKTRISTEKGRLANVEELPEEDILKIVKKELKEIRDTIESLRKAGVEERVPEEEKKIRVLETLLPTALPQEEIQQIIDETVQELGKDNFGQVMKVVMGRVAGRADGKLVSDFVRKALSEDE